MDFLFEVSLNEEKKYEVKLTEGLYIFVLNHGESPDVEELVEAKILILYKRRDQPDKDYGIKNIISVLEFIANSRKVKGNPDFAKVKFHSKNLKKLKDRIYQVVYTEDKEDAKPTKRNKKVS